jgi:hypothetical protein
VHVSHILLFFVFLKVENGSVLLEFLMVACTAIGPF